MISSLGLMLLTLFSLTITNLWMWRHNMIHMSTSSLQLVPLFLHKSPVFLQRRTFHRLCLFRTSAFFLWLRVACIYEKLSCWNCLWIEAALMLKQLNTYSHLFFFLLHTVVKMTREKWCCCHFVYGRCAAISVRMLPPVTLPEWTEQRYF